MMPRATRSQATIDVSVEIAIPALVTIENEPHKMFILPKNSSSQARMVLLRNPATSILSRYFYCPDAGLYDFTKLSSSRTIPRSCLIAAEREHEAQDKLQNAITLLQPLHDGYTLKNADLFIATPFDPIFFLLPLSSSLSTLYRPSDDYFDQLAKSSIHMEQLLREVCFRDLLHSRLRFASDVQDIGGGEEVYKLQLSVIATTLVEKASRAVAESWPGSMEEGLVQKELDVPIINFQSEGDQDPNMPSSAGDDPAHEASIPNAKLSDKVEASPVPNSIKVLMRQRTALTYIISTYVSPSIRPSLNAFLSKNGNIDFEPLNHYLEQIKDAKAEMQALRALSDNISRKRSALDDDEVAEARAEKKRKKEEDENKKKAETRAIKQLKKVDTTGMKKMSSFFTRATDQPQRQKTKT